MTITVESNDTEAIDLAEYVAFCHNQDKLHDREQVLSTAFMLQRLANNKHFLLDFLNTKLKDISLYDVKTDFTPPSFYLYQCPTFSVRAAVWLTDDSEVGDIAKGYGVTHNHHFDFLTCGYFGPGYRTIIHTCEAEKQHGIIGKSMEMIFQEETLLPEGKLMFYRHTEDFHVQLPPESLSISINLVFPTHPDAGIQCAIDPESSKLITHLDALPATNSLMAVARFMHNDDTTTLLQDIALNHHCPRTRAMCFQCLIEIAPSDQHYFLCQANQDPHDYVRSICRINDR
ncbi:hypothetical protein [Endozoicomonas elysicola]|uniref:Uncharacterized protein n=1 Tax=Endozoicomonas elysicola TaxID=305900 RepID=A0A081K6K2_9GAMM|nr:hypothetical protein [Endozoicomonas elysicola]KEI69778.1 hypothetical protein GV64_02610 [Endozoicomonas elysicola]